jgi:hypothetical protein
MCRPAATHSGTPRRADASAPCSALGLSPSKWSACSAAVSATVAAGAGTPSSAAASMMCWPTPQPHEGRRVDHCDTVVGSSCKGPAVAGVVSAVCVVHVQLSAANAVVHCSAVCGFCNRVHVVPLLVAHCGAVVALAELHIALLATSSPPSHATWGACRLLHSPAMCCKPLGCSTVMCCSCSNAHHNSH